MKDWQFVVLMRFLTLVFEWAMYASKHYRQEYMDRCKQLEGEITSGARYGLSGISGLPWTREPEKSNEPKG